MGRKRTLKNSNQNERKELNMHKKRQITQSKRLSDLLGPLNAKKLSYEEIHYGADLQNACVKNLEKLLKIEDFGPATVHSICRKVGVDVPLSKLSKIYSCNENNKLQKVRG